MNKYILLTLGIVALLGIGVYFFYAHPVQQPVTSSQSEPSQASTTTTTGSSIHVPVSLFPNNSSLLSFNDTHPLSFTNKSTGTTVSFHGTLPMGAGTPNSGSNLYVNASEIGQVEGSGILNPLFSPDNKNFGFIETDVCGATCEGFSIEILNLSTQKVLVIRPPRSAGAPISGGQNNPLIRSFVWVGPNTIEVNFFIVNMDGTGTYRVSPKEVWDYNLTTNLYTLISTTN